MLVEHAFVTTLDAGPALEEAILLFKSLGFEMEEQSDSLAEDIESAKDDWEQKKQDGGVPGARGEAGDEPPGEAAGDEDEKDS